MKKVVAGVLLAGTVLTGGNVFAEELEAVKVVSPTSEVYKTVQLMEQTEVELTKNPVEQAVILDENADESLVEAKVALEENNEDALIEAINNMITALEQLKATLVEVPTTEEETVENEDVVVEEDVVPEQDLTKVEEELEEKASQRGVNLRWMLENKDLPAQAKAGIAKAIENQERAWAKQSTKVEEEVVTETVEVESPKIPVVQLPKVEEEKVTQVEETEAPIIAKEDKKAEKEKDKVAKAEAKAAEKIAKTKAKAAEKIAKEEAKTAKKAAKEEAKAEAKSAREAAKAEKKESKGKE